MAGELKLDIDNSRYNKAANKALLLFLGLAVLLATTGTVVAWNFARERQILLSRSVYQLQGLCQGKTAFNQSLNDEVKQIAYQLEYLITNGQHQIQAQTAAIAEPSDETEPDQNAIILAVRFNNLALLSQQLARPKLLQMLEQKLSLIHSAAEKFEGSLHYSAEGNGLSGFDRNSGDPLNAAICCSRVIDSLVNDDEEQEEETPSMLLVEQGISTLQPTFPGDSHPALADSAAGQALLLANLGQGYLLLDKYDPSLFSNIETALISTSHGDDILEVGELSEETEQRVQETVEEIRATMATAS